MDAHDAFDDWLRYDDWLRTRASLPDGPMRTVICLELLPLAVDALKHALATVGEALSPEMVRLHPRGLANACTANFVHIARGKLANTHVLCAHRSRRRSILPMSTARATARSAVSSRRYSNKCRNSNSNSN
jgi:hypothetical protein